ncbi:transmembrane protein, putative [Bodo saltans]|uniref:Transmembrane protein, putative n=1 Tax=Bodo saltans TaxID=75058 RepID=A0A0S4JI01_BODSA|nr:transmembrane protein, putative [Bodo saltans]|eukprot:CUG91094.1 transmembrane protein, putative [Bodo saltans]
MLRRCSPKLYRYQEFEMSKNAKLPFYYAREAPNTSVFPQFQLTFWMHWGWGREELWFDKDQRRYETTWELLRRAILWFVPLFTIFPVGLPKYLAQNLYGEYGEKPFLDFSTRYPHDNMFLEYGGCTVDAEWIRHIHSKESY